MSGMALPKIMLQSSCQSLQRKTGSRAAACLITSKGRRFLSDAPSRRSIWRWGSAPGVMGKEEDAEISKEPSLISGYHGVTSAACGSTHSAFVNDGDLYTYGSNKYDELGRPSGNDRAEPSKVSFDGNAGPVVDISLGAHHSAAITEGGQLWTWGWGGSFWSGAGALGQGNREPVPTPKLVEKFVQADEKVVQVACGFQHTMVLTSEGRAYATGKGDFGRLGRGDTSDEFDFVEVDYFLEANDSILEPGEPTRIVKVGAGSNFSAALSSSGELWVWGQNDRGQLGLGEEAMGDMYSAERYPRLVRGLAAAGVRVKDFMCGDLHIVVLTTEGEMYEWGGNKWLEPHQIRVPEIHEDKLKTVKSFAAGKDFTFALCEDGSLFSWGAKGTACMSQKNLIEPTVVAPSLLGNQKVDRIVASNSRCLAITLDEELVG